MLMERGKYGGRSDGGDISRQTQLKFEMPEIKHFVCRFRRCSEKCISCHRILLQSRNMLSKYLDTYYCAYVLVSQVDAAHKRQ